MVQCPLLGVKRTLCADVRDDATSEGPSQVEAAGAFLSLRSTRMKRCPVCGANLADLAALRRKRNVERVMRNRHREKYNDYMRGYMLRYRARKREAASQ